jgi:hypothetical protein
LIFGELRRVVIQPAVPSSALINTSLAAMLCLNQQYRIRTAMRRVL